MSSEIAWHHVSCVHVSCVLLRYVEINRRTWPRLPSRRLWICDIGRLQFPRVRWLAGFNMFQHVRTCFNCGIMPCLLHWSVSQTCRVTAARTSENTSKTLDFAEQKWKKWIENIVSKLHWTIVSHLIPTYLADLGRIFLIFEPCLSTRPMVNLQPAPWNQNTSDVYVILFQTFQSSGIDETWWNMMKHDETVECGGFPALWRSWITASLEIFGCRLGQNLLHLNRRVLRGNHAITTHAK